jgi:hypothetical protein
MRADAAGYLGGVARHRVLWIVAMGTLVAGGVALDLRYVDIAMTVGIFLMAGAVAGSIFFNLAWPRRHPGQRLAISTVLVGAAFAAATTALCGYWVWLRALR